MSARLTAEFKVKALIRRVHDAGGSAMVLARGDPLSGTVLVLALDRGANPAFYERAPGLGERAAIIRSGPVDSDDATIGAYWRRRRERDPDLWVVEADIASAERFVAETIAAD